MVNVSLSEDMLVKAVSSSVKFPVAVVSTVELDDVAVVVVYVKFKSGVVIVGVRAKLIFPFSVCATTKEGARRTHARVATMVSMAVKSCAGKTKHRMQKTVKYE